MPFFLIAIGSVLAASAINGKHKELGDLWKAEIVPFGNIALVLFLLGALGAITGLRPIAIGLMTLVLVVFFLRNAGSTDSLNFISRIRQELSGGAGATQTITTGPLPEVNANLDLPPLPQVPTIH